MDRSSRSAALAFSAILAPYLALVWRYWFVCDDAFITFRYSRNWALGHGPRYNLGEHVPVEGYSNFLWMAIATLVELVGASPATVMPWLSLACGVALLALVFHTLLRRLDTSLPVATFATLFLATFPPFAVWSTSGLATVPQALFMCATLVFLTLEDDDRAPLWAAGTALLLALVRTEGIAWAVVIGVLAGIHRALSGKPVVRHLARFAGPLVLGFALYFAWRFTYYESLVANTAYAKVHMTGETMGRGLKYVGLYVATLVSPAMLLLVIPVGLTAPRWRFALVTGAMAIGVPAYAVTVSGDYMTWFRILVPGAAFMALSLGLAMQAVAVRGRAALIGSLVAAVACSGMSLLPVYDVHLTQQKLRKKLTVRDKLGVFRTENRQWEAMVAHSTAWRQKGIALGNYAKPGDTYVAAAIGNIGYFSGVFIYDRNGLVNREVAMLPFDGELRSPGHDKVVDRSLFFKYEPTILDSKLVHGFDAAPKIKAAMKEMMAAPVRDQYFPELITLAPLRGSSVPRYFVPLRRAKSTRQSEKKWAIFRAQLADLP